MIECSSCLQLRLRSLTINSDFCLQKHDKHIMYYVLSILTVKHRLEPGVCCCCCCCLSPVLFSLFTKPNLLSHYFILHDFVSCVYTLPDRFSCLHEKLSDIVWTSVCHDQLRKRVSCNLAPCKRTQRCWPTTPNVVGCYMLRPGA